MSLTQYSYSEFEIHSNSNLVSNSFYWETEASRNMRYLKRHGYSLGCVTVQHACDIVKHKQYLKMAIFTFKDQHVIIKFLHLHETPIKIHQQLSKRYSDSIMDMKNVCSLVRQFKHRQMLCDSKRKESHPLTS